MTIKIDSSIDKIKEWISEKEVFEALLAFDLIETDQSGRMEYMRQIYRAKDAGHKGTYRVLIPNSKELFGTQQVIVPIGIPYTTCGEYFLWTDTYDEQNEHQLLTKGMVDNLPTFWQELAVEVKNGK